MQIMFSLKLCLLELDSKKQESVYERAQGRSEAVHLSPGFNLDITKCGDAGTKRGAGAENPRVFAERVSMVIQQK